VRITADGGSTGRGTLYFYKVVNHKLVKLASVRANSTGGGTAIVSSTRGVRIFRVIYVAPDARRPRKPA
jgi:hypothetical protein